MIALFFLVTILSALILLSSYAGERVSAAELPTPDTVYESYKNNPYLRFYEGEKGIAWTTIHPGGYSITSHGTYIYGGGVSIYRGEHGKEVIPDDVVSRKELQGPLPAGHHYYSAPVSGDVVPIGKWVLQHVDSRCVHGPFSACRDYEYYGIEGISNVKCGRPYDSGWVAYCADCGQALTGYVYTCDDCVRRIGYIFAGDKEFREKYPAEYLFICPICGDNLENEFAQSVHYCESFMSANRYKIVYDGNGAERGSILPSICYFGNADEYDGESVSGDTNLRENNFVKPGYIFKGWSDSPDSDVLFSIGESTSSIESYFTSLSGNSDDIEIKLYAVWEESDCSIDISGGSFGSSNGSYNGIENRAFEDDKNSFSRGHMYETYVNPDMLTSPSGYRVRLIGPDGEFLKDIYATTELAGWRFESDDPKAVPIETEVYGLAVSGIISGNVTHMSLSGAFTYVHSSSVKSNTDHAVALWKSSSLILPECNIPGAVLEGWYTEPDLNPESYVGGRGDIFIPSSDTVLYGSFTGFNLTVLPDYMGNESFGDLRYKGLTDLRIPSLSGYDVFKYFISSEYNNYIWQEAVCDVKEDFEPEMRRIFSGNGEYSEYTAPVAGVYSFVLWGGAGASYAGYLGESGESSSCRIFLNKGDIVGIYTGAVGDAINEEGTINCYGGEGSYIEINGERIMSCAGGDGATFVLNVSKAFEYSGSVQFYTVETDGEYTLEVWGAAGAPTREGRDTSGSGGYASGHISLKSGDVLYICVGGRNGYNGGGSGGGDAYGGAGGNGGGATHIAFADGLLRSLSGNRDSVCIVAGGGGGSGGSMASSGSGGGVSGGAGISPWPGGEGWASGGSQTSAGYGGGFGYGGSGLSFRPNSNISAMINNGGGGGGWYGGAGGMVDRLSYGCGGGGGSGYIGGVKDGIMTTGGRGGNGYAVISCSVNIYGSEAVGAETDFNPGSLLYSDHVVKDHQSSIYPEDDELKNGYCIIIEPEENYYNDSDAKILTPDITSPNPVSEAYLMYDNSDGCVSINWCMPDDNGTDYRYMACAYRMSDVMNGSNMRAQTNIRSLDIKTGIYSYYYLIDTSPTRDASYISENGNVLMSAWSEVSGSAPDAYFDEWYKNASYEKKLSSVRIIPDGTDKYIHIIATDRAGNDSIVFDMAVDGDGAHIPYPLKTGDLVMTPSENVYADTSRDRTYYVRADGSTAFSIGWSAFLVGYARSTYQPDVARFHMSGSEYAEFEFDRNPYVMNDCDAVLLSSSVFGPFLLKSEGIMDAVRRENSTSFSITGRFTTMSEEEMYIYPSAHARFESGLSVYGSDEGMVSSDRNDDLDNGITIIGDKTFPESYVSVNGSEYLRLRECDISNVSTQFVIDRRCEEVNIDLYVRDSGSGLKGGFEIRVINLDNGLNEKYESDGEHFRLELKMDPSSEDVCFDNKLFNGRFIVCISSEDNVGNYGTEESAGITELDADVKIIRTLDEITGSLIDSFGNMYMKKGESGYVSSRVWGYPDAVLVSFDDESLSEYDVLYVTGSSVPVYFTEYTGTIVWVDSPEYYIECRTDFIIPLGYDEDDVSVTITCCKGDEMIIWEARCMVVSSGSVLDELMTVLR